jgi:hypothetical protein
MRPFDTAFGGRHIGAENLDAELVQRSTALRRTVAANPRAPRQYFGELIQIDGSEHRWLEVRGPMCPVLTYVDGATSRLQLLRFVEGVSRCSITRQATKTYIERYDKPVCFYGDKHTVFRVNKRSGRRIRA